MADKPETRKDTAAPQADDIQTISPTLAGADTTAAFNAPAHDYKQEVRGSSWRIERTADEGAIREQLEAADEDAEQTNERLDAADPDYVPPS